MKTILLITIAALVLLPVQLTAGPNKEVKEAAAEKNRDVDHDQKLPQIDSRIEKMRLLIEKGTKNGALTKAESGSLTRELKVIEQREERYRRSMDKVSGGERRKLSCDINDLHRRIQTKVENAATAPEKPREPAKKP